MLSQQPLKRAGQVLFLLAAGATACQRSQPPQPPPSPVPATTGAASSDSAFWVSGWTYYLRPVQPGAAADADKGKGVWRNLFPAMAKDAKTRELLTRLHGGWAAELIAVDSKQAKDKSAFKAAPLDGVAVVLRVADLNHKAVETKSGPVPFREIAYSRVIRIKGAGISGLPLGRKEPLPGEALDLAIEDFVLRHAPGWVARQGPGIDTSFADDEQLRRSAEDSKLPPNVEDQRRELDQKIKEYADRAKAYYGAMSKP